MQPLTRALTLWLLMLALMLGTAPKVAATPDFRAALMADTCGAGGPLQRIGGTHCLACILLAHPPLVPAGTTGAHLPYSPKPCAFLCHRALALHAMAQIQLPPSRGPPLRFLINLYQITGAAQTQRIHS